MGAFSRPLLCALVALAIAFGSVPARAQVSVPDTPAGRAFSAWLQAFDSGDAATFRKFAQAQYPSSLNRIDRVMQFYQISGGFDLKQIESSAPAKIVALVEDRLTEQFARLTLTMDPAVAGRIALVGVEAIDTPAAYEPQHLTQTALIAALKTKLDADTAAGRFSGDVLIAHDGATVFAQAYGLADRAKNLPNTLQTQFRIGSMNKMFTAVSILQLVEAGKVRLDAPLGTYLTDYPNHDVATKVTIQELLSHTGGTGDIFGPDFDAHRLQLQTLQDYEKLYGSRAPAFPPGSKYEYSNYGFILLGLVIEKVSGQSYYEYVRQHVYAPSGMTASDSQPEGFPVPNRSVGYTQDDNGKWIPNTDTLPYRGTSAGGGYSTVGDFASFAAALQKNALLDPHYTDLLTTGKVATENGSSTYAFGFDDETVNGIRCFGHGGGAPGMNGDLRICPVAGYVVVVLANLDPPAARRISDFIAKRLPLPAK